MASVCKPSLRGGQPNSSGSNIVRDGGQTREEVIGLEKSLGRKQHHHLGARDSGSSYIHAKQAYYLY